MKRLCAPLLLTLIAALLPAGASATVISGSVVASSPAGRTVQSCMRDSKSLLVDVMIDRSRSLRVTDPEDRRVDGVGAALFGLARVAGEGGEDRQPRVEVLLSSFAAMPAPRHAPSAWRVVDDRSLPGLLEQAERLGDRDDGSDTDYALALREGRQALNARAVAIAGEDEAQPCKVLIFLSDGKFQVGDRTRSSALPRHVPYAPGVDLATAGGGGRAVAAGHRYLCRDGGLRDRMVGDGTTMFTVALSGSPQFTPADRAFLEALTNGGKGKTDCGSDLSPRTGEYIEINDSFDLFYGLGTIVTDSNGEPKPGPCYVPGTCPNPTEFDAVPGLSGFILSASAPLSGVKLELTGPSGEQRVLRDGSATEFSVGGATVHQHWIRSRSMEMEAEFERDSDAWVGPWRFRFFAPSAIDLPVPAYDLTLLSALRPRLVGDPALLPGGRRKLVVGLFEQGKPVEAGALVDAAKLEAEVIDAGGAARPAEIEKLGSGRFALPVAVPEDEPDGTWKIRVEVSYPGESPAVEAEVFSLPVKIEGKGGTDYLIVLAIVAGVLALLAIVALAISYRNRLARARFTAPHALRAFRCKVAVTARKEISMDPDPGPLGLRFDDLDYLAASGRYAEVPKLKVSPFQFRSRVPWRFGAQPSGEATAAGRALLAGGTNAGVATSTDRMTCTIPLELAGTWLFAAEWRDEEGTVHGDLVLFTDDLSPTGLAQELLEEARTALVAEDWEEIDLPPGVDESESDIDDDLASGAGEINWDSV